MKSGVNRILIYAIFAFVSLTFCGQQSFLIAVQNGVPTPKAHKGDLTPATTRQVVFSPDESKIVTWDVQHSPGFVSTTELKGIQVWDLATNEIRVSTSIPVYCKIGKWMGELNSAVGRYAHKDFALISHFSDGEGAVASYRQDASGLHEISMHKTKGPVGKLVRSRSGNLIAAICNPSVELIGMPALNQQITLQTTAGKKTGSIRSVAISDDDALVAVCVQIDDRSGYVCIINIYDSRTGEVKRTLKPPDFVTSMAFAPDSTRFAAGIHMRHYIWSLTSEQNPEVLSIDDNSVTVLDAISGKSFGNARVNNKSETIAFRTEISLISVLSGGGVDSSNGLQFAEWEDNRQKSIFGIRQKMSFLRADDNDKDIMYFVENGDIVALDTVKKRIVKRFVTHNIRGTGISFDIDATGGSFDIDPKRNLVLGTNHKAGEYASIFLANWSNGKVESAATLMEYVNDGLCLPEGVFIVGGRTSNAGNLEIVNLKSGTTVEHLENQSLQSFGSCRGLNYFITTDHFPKTDKMHFWRLEDCKRFASVAHAGLQRVVVSPSEELVASISSDAISVWSVERLRESFEAK